MKKLYLLIFLLIPTLHSCTYFKTKNAQITISNLTPYHQLVAMNYKPHPDSSITMGWMLFEPGMKKTFSKEFYSSDAEFHITTKSARRDAELVRWYFDLPYTNDGIRFLTNTNYSTQKGHVPLSEDYEEIVNQQITDASNYTQAAFETIDASKSAWRKYQCSYEIKDDGFSDLFEKHKYSFPLGADDADKGKMAYEILMKEFKKEGRLVLYNAAPYGVKVALSFQYTKDSSGTVGWFELPPGKEKIF